MSAFTDLASDAMIKNGLMAPGETLEANLGEYAMREGNRLLDDWNVQSLFIWSTTILVFNLTARTLPQYWFTIGQTGGTTAPDFAVTIMPTRIIRANLLLQTSTPNARIPLEVLLERQWADETVPALGATIPIAVYYDYSNTPNGQVLDSAGYFQPVSLSNMYVWPYPTQTQNQLELFVPNNISRFSQLTDTFNMPPGYTNAFMLTLAERTIEGIREIPQTLASAAARARANVRSLNSRSPKISTTDSGMPGKPGTRGSYFDGWQALQNR